MYFSLLILLCSLLLLFCGVTYLQKPARFSLSQDAVHLDAAFCFSRLGRSEKVSAFWRNGEAVKKFFSVLTNPPTRKRLKRKNLKIQNLIDRFLKKPLSPNCKSSFAYTIFIYFFWLAIPGLFFADFQTIYRFKTVDFSGIWTRIDRIEICFVAVTWNSCCWSRYTSHLTQQDCEMNQD